MRLRILLFSVLLAHSGPISSAGPKLLEGCIAPKDTASALAKLRERGWTLWTPEVLAKTWPRPLTPQDCQSPQGVCTLLGHRGRGGSDQPCECCETFDFFADRDGEVDQRLNAVVVFYSAERYADVLAAARLLAKAMGLPESEGPVGQKQQPPPGKTVMQHFEWKEASVKKGAVLDLRISHEKLWTLYITVGWHPGV